MIRSGFMVFLLLVFLSVSSANVLSATVEDLRGDITDIVDYSGRGESTIRKLGEKFYTIELEEDGLAKICLLFKLSNTSDQPYEFDYDLKLEINVTDPQTSLHTYYITLLTNPDYLVLPAQGVMEVHVQIPGDLGEIRRGEPDGPDDGGWEISVTPSIRDTEISLSQRPLSIEVYTSPQETPPPGGFKFDWFWVYLGVTFIGAIAGIYGVIVLLRRKGKI